MRIKAAKRAKTTPLTFQEIRQIENDMGVFILLTTWTPTKNDKQAFTVYDEDGVFAGTVQPEFAPYLSETDLKNQVHGLDAFKTEPGL